MNIDTLISKFVEHIFNPTIKFLFALALFWFLYGVLKFVRNADNEAERNTGQQHIMYGVIGMFIMVSVFAIIRLALGTFNIPLPDTLK